MLTRETCTICGSGVGYRWVEAESGAYAIFCTQNGVLEVDTHPRPPQLHYGREIAGTGVVVDYVANDPTDVTGLTAVQASWLTLARWEHSALGQQVGPFLDGAMRAWLALPLDERCPS